MIALDGQSVPLLCLSCGEKTHKTVGWIKENSAFECSCGSVVNFNSEVLRKKLVETETRIQELLSQIKDAPKH